MAQFGYASQASTIAASAFEAANAMGMIGTNAGRAERWLAHKDPDTAPWNVWDCVRGTVTFIGTDSEEIESVTKAEYRLYKRLCTSKHVNQLLERGRYVRPGSEQNTVLRFTPKVTPQLLRQAQLALAMSIRATTTAVWCFSLANLTDPSPIVNRVMELTEQGYRFMKENWADNSPSEKI